MGSRRTVRSSARRSEMGSMSSRRAPVIVEFRCAVDSDGHPCGRRVGRLRADDTLWGYGVHWRENGRAAQAGRGLAAAHDRFQRGPERMIGDGQPGAVALVCQHHGPRNLSDDSRSAAKAAARRSPSRIVRYV